jgi:glycosyltransferase involved in cell wall biosynthesis
MIDPEPFFSVVIPLYNKEPTIAATLNSALGQTWHSFEIIVVNDGSADGSLAVVEAFTDNRLSVYSKPNGGVSAARNYGIERARGKYIAFLDADDNWEPGYLAEMKTLIDKYPQCGLYASAYRRITRNKIILRGNELDEGITDDFFKAKMQHGVPFTSATIIKKQVFDDVGGYPVGMIGGEDDYTCSKIAIKYKVAFTPKILVLYDTLKSTYSSRKGKMDNCTESWLDLYQEGDFYRNEFIALKAINAGIRYAYGAPQKKSTEIERKTRYTVLSKSRWKYLYYLNRMPYLSIILLRTIFPHYKKVKFWLADKKKQMLKGSVSAVH